MPNHVTNILKASEEVLTALVNGEKVDFRNVLPWNLPNEIGSFYSMAEWLAEEELGLKPEFMSSTESSQEIVAQKNLMVENYKQTGYFHEIDFARKEWGTKWNAYDSNIQKDRLIFQTAWSAPIKVIIALSKQFPNEEITLTYADEDIGNNCGRIIFNGGELMSNNSLTLKECCEVLNYDYEQYLKDIAEDDED